MKLSVWLSILKTIHSSVQGRLGRIAKSSAFYSVSFTMEFVISKWNLGFIRNHTSLADLIWNRVLSNVGTELRKCIVIKNILNYPSG